MAGTKTGGLKAALQIRRTMAKNFMPISAKLGGSAPKTKPCGFACDRERARLAGAKGGRISSRAGIRNGEGISRRRVLPIEVIY